MCFVILFDSRQIHVNILINLILQRHSDLPLLPHLLHQINTDLSRQDLLVPVRKREVDEDLLDLVELGQLVLRVDRVRRIIHFLDFPRPFFSQVLCLHCFESHALFDLSIFSKPTDWDQLAKDQELDVATDRHLLLEHLDQD